MTIRNPLLCAAAFGAVLLFAGSASAQEIKELRVAKQFGISYLPLIVIEQRQLFEKHAKAAGLADVKINWIQLASGAPMNDALLSGNLEIAAGGQGPFITIWA
ncbi:MAG: ABC transporter substrate-binding protein, partial [Rhodospirillales bacterium]|nr:ABC transporter substrate-binding protein [Rhodospirillales bacterium]